MINSFVKKICFHPHIQEFIKLSEETLKANGYTNHGLTHCQFVAERAQKLAQDLKLSKREQELSYIAGYCHDMGNFLNRKLHHLLGALLFYDLFKNKIKVKDLMTIVQAIAFHDKKEMNFINPVSAILVIADKSDVRRERVYKTSLELIKKDIHDRVNYATYSSQLKTDPQRKEITLLLKIDTNFVSLIEYFEIFTQRMIYCRKAAKYLNCQFHLIINDIKFI
ncbi:MAG: HD domain-containing protein [Candidatus Paceibacterota bacterium]